MKTKRRGGWRSIEALESRQLMAVLATEIPAAGGPVENDAVAVAGTADMAAEIVVGPQSLSKLNPTGSPGSPAILKATMLATRSGMAMLGASSQPVLAQSEELSGRVDSIQGQDANQAYQTYTHGSLDPTSPDSCSATFGGIQSADPLQRAQSYMNALGVRSLSDLGTIYVRAENGQLAWDLSPGIHVLRSENPLTGISNLDTPACWTVHETELTGTLTPAATSDVLGGAVEAGPLGADRTLQGGGALDPGGMLDPAGTIDIAGSLDAAGSVNIVGTDGTANTLELARSLAGSTSAGQSQLVAAGPAPTMSTQSQNGSSGSELVISQTTAGTNYSSGIDRTLYDPSASVVRYEGSMVSDVAVILASKVVFESAELILSDSVPEFFIIAETIESSDDSVIRWIHSGTQAEARSDADDGADGHGYSPHTETSGATFDPRHGSDGSDGDDGTDGNPGLDAPDVFFILKTPTVAWETSDSGIGGYAVTLPQVDLRGQDGGVGQRGGDGGDGGDGAKGLHAELRYALGVPIECKRGAGYGGDGGDGGDAGDGGDGGDGGAGGDITILHVEPAMDPNGNTAWWGIDDDYLTSRGEGGAGGARGSAGQGGEGGDAGDASRPWCRDEQDTRSGDDGQDGESGTSGSRGDNGMEGEFMPESITLEEWEQYFTAPYLVSASAASDEAGDAIVTVEGGEFVTLETLNISGSATLAVDDEYDNSATMQYFPLTDLGGGRYGWTVPSGLDTSRFLIQIERGHDGEVTNTYRVEVVPVIDELTFGSICIPPADDPTTTTNESLFCGPGKTVGTTYFTEDPYEARLGGWAHFIGTGLRSDSEVIFDGQSLGTPVAGVLDDGRDILSFQIPVLNVHDTFFAGDEGDVEHTVYLDQIAPLESTEELELTLLKNYRLTFEPTVNGFGFSNSAMTPVAKQEANNDIWQAFRDVYGEMEVDAELLEAGISMTAGILSGGVPGILDALAGSADLWGSFLIFSTFWSPGTASAMCTGMSSLSLDDYFNGVTDQIGVTPTDVDRSVMLAQSRILSEEMLSSFLAQMATPDATTRSTVEEVVAFLRDGSSDPTADAPMLVFLPTISNLFDVANAHTVAPYQVVYDDPSDPLPSRIYLYDNNAPASGLWSATDPSIMDRVFLEVDEVLGDVEFTYDMLDGTFSSPYDYNTDDNWVLAREAVDSAFAEASLPLGVLDLILPD